MSLGYYLRDFKDDFRDELSRSDTKTIISNNLNSLSKLPNAASEISSFGIGIGLGILGQYLAKKKRGSPAARAIARILGAPVDEINRDFVLAQLSNEGHRGAIRQRILEVAKSASIDKFAESLKPPLSSGEAWEVYRQIKDMVLDAEIMGIVTQTFNEVSGLEITLVDEVQKMIKAIDQQSSKQIREVKQYLADLEMFRLGLRVWTGSEFIIMGKGSNDCWKKGRFTIAEVKSGYDLRRIQTNEITNSVQDNVGTILFGDSYSGKSTVLSRIIFEKITETGYVIIYGDGIKAQARLLAELVDRVAERFPESRVLLIADNVHRSGSEELFKLFNEYKVLPSDRHIRFLFAARESELDITRKTLERSDRDEIKDALIHMRQIRLIFDKEDAINFLKQASIVSNIEEHTTRSDQEIEKEAKQRYEFSEGDLFMFIYAIQNFIGGNKLYKDFVREEMIEKIATISKDFELARAAILCSFLGMFGVKLSSTLLDRCHVYFDIRNILIKEGFLFHDATNIDVNEQKEADEPIVKQYKVRHERWSQEFLFYLYEEFNNSFQQFDDKYKVREILGLILNSVDDLNDIISIFNTCTSLYGEKHSKPIVELFINNFEIPANLNHMQKMELYSDGLGMFYLSINDTVEALKCFERALEIDSDCAIAWTYKGETFDRLGKKKEAIECFERALEIDPNNSKAWILKGQIHDDLGERNKSVYCYHKALIINVNNADAWNYRGAAFDNLGERDKAIECFDKAIEINPKHYRAAYGKGLALYNVGEHRKAIECFDKAIEINPNYVYAWTNKGAAHNNLGEHRKAIECFDKAIDLDKTEGFAWYNKGYALRSLGEHDQANRCFDKAKQLGF